MGEHVPKFGEIIRCYRLGYAWSAKYQCYVRMEGEQAPWRIDVRPNHQLPKSVSRVPHRVWWDSHELLDMIEDMPHSPRSAETFYVDDNGRRLAAAKMEKQGS